MKKYYVYILTNESNTVLYTGVTNNIERRLFEHREKLINGFTAKYQIKKLVYLEEFCDVYEAIAREKQIKGGSRKKKVLLIEENNPRWSDLSKE